MTYLQFQLQQLSLHQKYTTSKLKLAGFLKKGYDNCCLSCFANVSIFLVLDFNDSCSEDWTSSWTKSFPSLKLIINIIHHWASFPRPQGTRVRSSKKHNSVQMSSEVKSCLRKMLCSFLQPSISDFVNLFNSPISSFKLGINNEDNYRYFLYKETLSQ